MGTPLKAGLQVVILAGGFGQDLVAALAEDITGLNRSQQATIQGLRSSIIQRGVAGSEPRVNTALVPLHQRKSIEYTFRALEGVRRALPLAGSVRVVVNAPDRELFVGVRKGCLFSEISDLGLSEANLISNGKRAASEWQGDAADLAYALACGAVDTAVPTLVLSSSLALFPGYNLQRIVEHSIVRNRDTIGVRTLGSADISLLGPAGHTITRAADTIPVPPLASLTPGSTATAGDEVAEPILLLQPATLRVIAGGMPLASGTDLRGLAASLLTAGIALHSIELGLGTVRLDTPAACDFADRLINYLFANLKPAKGQAADGGQNASGALAASIAGGEAVMGKFVGGQEHANQQTLVQRSELRDEFVADASEAAAAMSLNRQFGQLMADSARVARVVAQFERLHFTGERMAAATSMKHYVLPSTFYMTAYRRQAADMMR